MTAGFNLHLQSHVKMLHVRPGVGGHGKARLSTPKGECAGYLFETTDISKLAEMWTSLTEPHPP